MGKHPAADAIRAACARRRLSLAAAAALVTARGVPCQRSAMAHWTSGRRVVPLYAVDAVADAIGLDDVERGVVRGATLARAAQLPAQRVSS